MRHLSEGTLRRLYDDPHAIEERDRRHFAGCEVCRERLDAIAGDAREARQALLVDGVTVDSHAAYERLRRALPESGRERRPVRAPFRLAGWRVPALGVALALVLVGALTLSPFGASLDQLFQPKQIQPVTLSSQDVDSLQPLASYGTVAWQSRPAVQSQSSAAAAASASGLAEIQPTNLPTGASALPESWDSMNQSVSSFTFDQAKAAAQAARDGRQAPTFPAGVDGSTLVLKGGPGEAAIYGDTGQLKSAEQSGDTSNIGSVLAIGEARAPTVYSTGVSLDELKQVLLSQPGLTANARNLIQSLGGSAGSLPIPIPLAQASATSVTVHGVQGTAFGDNTGLGAAVVWIQNGVVYAVGGTYSLNQVLAVANGLP
ncbi:MAG TPA: hypothetical protein VIA06_19265 [Candidatus Dormibacteraeota bacterium]|jgi:hypothetical protein|nr:hypothetical protein [Candidatus Dormibacteraeota bacterium]